MFFSVAGAQNDDIVDTIKQTDLIAVHVSDLFHIVLHIYLFRNAEKCQNMLNPVLIVSIPNAIISMFSIDFFLSFQKALGDETEQEYLTFGYCSEVIIHISKIN
jgi:hypothetical protein